MTAIFVVGMPRTGTTLVQSLIATSPEVVSFPESHVFNAAKPLFCPKYPVTDFFWSNFCLNLKLWKLGFPSLIVATTGQQVVRKINNVFENRAHREGVKYYLEKTPSHLYFVRAIYDAIPDSKFVFVMRGAKATISSYLKANSNWGKRADEADGSAAIARWFNDTVLSLTRAQDVGGLIVQYENIVNPLTRDSEVKKIEEYLKIAVSCDSEQLKASASSLVKSGEFWKNQNLEHGIQEKRLTEADQELLENIDDVFESLKRFQD